MPAGAVGTVWESGSWTNVCWEANAWADARIITPAAREEVRAPRRLFAVVAPRRAVAITARQT